MPTAFDARASRRGDVILSIASYEKYDGTYEALPYLGVYLCLEGGGALARVSDAQALEGVLLPGRVGLGAAHAGGVGYGARMRLLGLGIAGGRLEKLVGALPHQRLDVEALASSFHDDPLLDAVMRAMWTEADDHGASTAFFDHALAVLIHQLARKGGGLRPAGTYALDRRQLSQAIDFIDSHLDGDIAVADMAALAGLSENHFSRCFRASTGLAPYAFLTRRRLDRAADFLLHSTLPVIEVAALAGYANPSQFSAAFRRYKGTTPLRWRQTEKAS